MNCNHFQVAVLAYNLNFWLMLFNRQEEAPSKRSNILTWQRRVCGFRFWRPRSGAMPEKLVSATATTTASKESSAG